MAGFVNGTLVLDAFPFSTSAGDNDDVAMGGSLMFITPTNNNDAITGIVPDGNLGFLVFAANIHATNNLVIKNNDSGSTATARIMCQGGTDLTVGPRTTALLGYDTVNQYWQVIRFVS